MNDILDLCLCLCVCVCACLCVWSRYLLDHLGMFCEELSTSVAGHSQRFARATRLYICLATTSKQEPSCPLDMSEICAKNQIHLIGILTCHLLHLSNINNITKCHLLQLIL